MDAAYRITFCLMMALILLAKPFWQQLHRRSQKKAGTYRMTLHNNDAAPCGLWGGVSDLTMVLHYFSDYNRHRIDQSCGKTPPAAVYEQL